MSTCRLFSPTSISTEQKTIIAVVVAFRKKLLIDILMVEELKPFGIEEQQVEY